MNPGWRRRAARTGDGGFTLLEVVISVVLVGIMMTALVSFFVSTTAILNQQRDRQVAVQLADSVMEGVRAKGLTIVTGRTAGNADTSTVPNVDLSTMSELDGGTFPTDRATVASLPYQEYVFLGTCGQVPSSSGDVPCTKLTSAQALAQHRILYYRVVVAVTWPDTQCGHGICSYATATLISCGTWTTTDPCVGTEPVFRVGS